MSSKALLGRLELRLKRFWLLRALLGFQPSAGLMTNKRFEVSVDFVFTCRGRASTRASRLVIRGDIELFH
jgi:hypothetical protein